MRKFRFSLVTPLLSSLLSAILLITSACEGQKLTGKMSYFSLPAPYETAGTTLVADPNGNFWFTTVAYEHFGTNQSSGAIGCITPQGKITLFPLPSLNSYPQEIVVGSDGNLWFTAVQGSGKVEYGIDTPPGFEQGFYEIGFMTPTGKFTFLKPLPVHHYTGAIIVGPDGHIWFVDEFNIQGNYSYSLAHVVSSTDGGTITTFALPKLQHFDSVVSLLTGADGNLWFGVVGVTQPIYEEFGKIGRMTPKGDLQMFSLGTSTEPRSLAVGSDQNIWFACSPGVARVTPEGKLRVFTPSGVKVRYCGSPGFAADPTGGFWYFGENAVQHVATVEHVSSDGSTFISYPIPPASQSQLLYGPIRFLGIVPATDGTIWLLSRFTIEHMI